MYFNRIGTLVAFLSMMVFTPIGFSQPIGQDSLADSFVLKFNQALPLNLFEDETNGISTIETLEKITLNKSNKIRSYAHFKLQEIGIKSKSNKVREKAVYNILKFSYDSDIAIRRNNADFYTSFPKESFTKDFVNELKIVLHNDSFVNRGHILLVGFLELKEEKQYLESHFIGHQGRFLNDFSLGDINNLNFAARMALARLGSKEDLEYVIQKVKDASEKEILLYRLKYLSYLKQPEAIEILFDFLFMDKTLPDVTGWERPYANYVIPYIYQSVDSFPVSNNGWFGHSEAEIEQARNWVAANRKKYKINRNFW